MYFLSVVPSVAGVCVKQNPCVGLGPPGLDSQAASFTALWISDWHFGKVTPQLILSNPFHGHRLSQPATHPSNQPDHAASPISPLPYPLSPLSPLIITACLQLAFWCDSSLSFSNPSSCFFSFQALVADWLPASLLWQSQSVGVSVIWPVWNNYWMDCDEIWYTH